MPPRSVSTQEREAVVFRGAERMGQLQIDGTTTPIALEYGRSDGLIQQVVNVDGWSRTSTQADVRPDLPPADSWWLGYLRGLHPREYGAGTPSIRVGDLFCASGGLSLGLHSAASALGLSVSHELAVDIDGEALKVFERNHLSTLNVNKSVRDLVDYTIRLEGGRTLFGHAPKVVSNAVAGLIGGLDLLVAGPPCQGHSTFNNHSRFNDPRNLLYLSVPAMAVALDVPAVVIENVPGVRASKEGVARAAFELLTDAGYEVTHGVIKADELGWPQRRSRFFLIATKGWSPLPITDVVRAMAHAARPISWALEDVIDRDEGSVMTDLPRLSQVNIDRINHLHDEGIFDLPNAERPDCHKDGTTYGAVYGRMKWDAPAQTLTTGFLTPGRGRYVHALRRRTLTPREAARLQGFPDSYDFRTGEQDPSRKNLTKWIGDAVPAPLGMAAALAALATRPRAD